MFKGSWTKPFRRGKAPPSPDAADRPPGQHDTSVDLESGAGSGPHGSAQDAQGSAVRGHPDGAPLQPILPSRPPGEHPLAAYIMSSKPVSPPTPSPEPYTPKSLTPTP
jgi:hypothetical protein